MFILRDDSKSTHLFQHLYQEGARAFWIHNTGPIGCLPVTLHYYHRPLPGILDQHGCVIAQNNMAKKFNKQLKRSVIRLREQLPDAALTYVDVFAAKYKLIRNAKNEGHTETQNFNFFCCFGCCHYIFTYI